MPRFKVRGNNKTVDLTKDNFRAKGGEGSIHIIGNTVYKVCDPGKMIDIRKLVELHALDHPKIIRPDDIIEDSKKSVVGYTMKLVPGNAVPLAQILSKTYREREGVKPDDMANLVRQIADGIRYIHRKPGYLQVDGNEYNYMVTSDFKDVYFIDVNSFQTPSFPADAIMPSIRDWQCPSDTTGYFWSHNTDWYSFAIISWYMFTAIHPFKGRHPRFPDLKASMVEQMKAGVSVLDPETMFPQAAVYFPFENFIPGGKDGAYMQWYRAIFTQNKRLPAPLDFQAVLVVATNVKEISGSNNFNINMIREFASPIIGFYESSGREVVVTKDEIYVDNQPKPKPQAKFRVGFTPNNVPIALILEDDKVRLHDLQSSTPLTYESQAEEIMSCEGRLYVKSGKDISEMVFIERNGSVFVAQRSVASVMPAATQLFQGVAFQDMFGARMASVFPESGHHRQFKLDELDKFQITDAKYERGVLMVLADNKEQGKTNRFIFRFASDWSSYDCRIIENVVPMGLNFTVLSNGVVVCITEEEKVEIFSSRKGSPDVKSITDPAIKADMRVCHSGTQVKIAHGQKMYNISVKK